MSIRGETFVILRDFPRGSVVKNLPASVGDKGSIPGSRRSLGEGNGYLLQCSCLGNPMDQGTWWATVHGVAESPPQLSMSVCIVILQDLQRPSESRFI